MGVNTGIENSSLRGKMGGGAEARNCLEHSKKNSRLNMAQVTAARISVSFIMRPDPPTIFVDHEHVNCNLFYGRDLFYN